MSKPTHRELEAALEREIDKLARETLKSRGAPPKHQIESLSRLRQLVEMSSREQNPWRGRGIAAAALALSLATVSLLLWLRVGATEIFADLELSQVSFRLTSDDVLIGSAQLQSLTVTGFHSAKIPSSGQWGGMMLTPENSPSTSFRLAAVGAESRLNLGAVELLAGTRVWIEPRPAGCRLAIEGQDLEITASLLGKIDLDGDLERSVVRFEFPKQAEFFADEGVLEIDLTLGDADSLSFTRQLPVAGLGFDQVRSFGRLDRVISAVRSGSLYFLDLNGKEEKLRTSQLLSMANDYGRLRRIEIEPRVVRLEFQGHVEDLETGSEDNPLSLMPSWLQWLRARHALFSLWAGAIWLFGLIMATIKWLGVVR